MTLNIALRVALGSRTLFSPSSTTYPCLNYSVFYADTLCLPVALTFDLLTSNFYIISGIMRLNSLQNLSDIE